MPGFGPIPDVRDLTLKDALAYLVGRMGVRRAVWHLADDLDLDLQSDDSISQEEYAHQSEALQAMVDWAAQKNLLVRS